MSAEPVTRTTGIRRLLRVALADERVAPLAVQSGRRGATTATSSAASVALRLRRESRLEHLVTIELEIDPAKQPNRRSSSTTRPERAPHAPRYRSSPRVYPISLQ
jgi:hypothetical protein